MHNLYHIFRDLFDTNVFTQLNMKYRLSFEYTDTFVGVLIRFNNCLNYDNHPHIIQVLFKYLHLIRGYSGGGGVHQTMMDDYDTRGLVRLRTGIYTICL